MNTNNGERGRAEPIDAEFEEAADRRAARQAPQRRGSSGIGAPAALLLAVAAAGAGATGGAVAPRIAPVNEFLDKAVPAPAEPSGPNPQLAATAADLDTRLKSLETLVADPTGQIAEADGGAANVAARVFALQAGLRGVETQLQSIPSSQEINNLVGEVQRLQAELPEVAAAARTASDAARAAFAVAAATEASRASGPFEQSFASLKALLPEDPNVAALEPLSRTGAPTRQELREDFRDVSLNVIRAARQAQAGAGFWGRVQAALAQWVTVRRKGEGDTPDGVVERAQARLAADDLATAIQEMNRLSGPAAAAAAPWLENARRRLAIDTHLAAIRTELSRRG